MKRSNVFLKFHYKNKPTIKLIILNHRSGAADGHIQDRHCRALEALLWPFSLGGDPSISAQVSIRCISLPRLQTIASLVPTQHCTRYMTLSKLFPSLGLSFPFWTWLCLSTSSREHWIGLQDTSLSLGTKAHYPLHHDRSCWFSDLWIFMAHVSFQFLSLNLAKS